MGDNLIDEEVEYISRHSKIKRNSKLVNKIARLLCDKNNPIPSEPPNFEQPNSFWDKKASEPYKEIYRNVAREILEMVAEHAKKEYWHKDIKMVNAETGKKEVYIKLINEEDF